MSVERSNYQDTASLYYQGEGGSTIGKLIINLNRYYHFQKFSGKVNEWDDQKKADFVRSASSIISFCKKHFPLLLLVLGIGTLIAYGTTSGVCSESVLTLFKASGTLLVIASFLSCCCFLKSSIHNSKKFEEIFVDNIELKDAYEAFNMAPSTNRKEITERYIKLARIHHSDKNPYANPSKMAEINAARKTILDHLDNIGK